MTYMRSYNNNTINVWYFVDSIKTYNEKINAYEEQEQYVCYFKFNEPTAIIHGELLRQEDGKIKIFNDSKTALLETNDYVMKKFNLK